jgi:hypothetical protein
MNREKVKEIVENIISDMTGIKVISENDTLNKKNGLCGLESEELLTKIQKEFNTDFTDMKPHRFFDEGKFFLYPIIRTKAEDITVSHLIDVIVKGSWFEPE